MVNTKISQIANRIALGENKYKESQLLDEPIKAGEIVMKTATGIALATWPDSVLGVMKEHEDVDLDTDIAAGKYGDVITEGYVAVIIANLLDTKYPGLPLYYADGGKMDDSVFGPVLATLMRKAVSGDLVAIVKLMR